MLRGPSVFALENTAGRGRRKKKEETPSMDILHNQKAEKLGKT